MLSKNDRIAMLFSYGANEKEIGEILKYTENTFDQNSYSKKIEVPLEDERFVEDWRRYSLEKGSPYSILRDRLIQLNFPIYKGISKTELYEDATKRGIIREEIAHLNSFELKAPDQLSFLIHKTLAGSIPLIITRCREDFENLIRALAGRNEPIDIPKSMGAATIKGYNNWERIATYKEQWEKSNIGENNDFHWGQEFERLLSQAELYKDTFIILSDGPYSSISHEEIGIPELEWKDISLNIRKEHEVTHYFTKRFFNSMKNNIMDEIICDYNGIVYAIGDFKVDWILKFLGLENYPSYREGGRFQNYIPSSLSERSIAIIRKMTYDSVKNLALAHNRLVEKIPDTEWRAKMTFTLTSFTLEELAHKDGFQWIENKFHHINSKWLKS